MTFSTDWQAAYKALLGGPVSRGMADGIVRTSLHVGASYLRYLVRTRMYSFSSAGLRVIDVASDLLAELLAEDDDGPCGGLRDGLRRWFDERETADEPGGTAIEGAVRAILYTTITQQLPRFFAEIDPVRGRILRSLRRAARRERDIIVTQAIDGRWYCREHATASLREPPLPFEQLRVFASAVPLDGHPEAGLLHGLLDALDDLSGVRRAVHEQDLLALLVERLAAAYSGAQTESDAIDDCPDSVTGAIDGSLDEIRGTLIARFVREGKLDEREAAAFLEAGRRYCLDAANEDTDPLHAYLIAVIPGLTREAYRERYRNRFEYFLRTLFRTAGDRLVLSDEQRTTTHDRHTP